MNYFPFDPDPLLSARALDDKRLRRVFQEAVMVSAEYQRARIPERENPYPKKMPMPQALMDWLLRDTSRALWFSAWTHALLQCNIERFGCGVGQWQATEKYLRLSIRTRALDSGVTIPPSFVNLARSQAKGLDYTHIEDVHVAYRQYVAHQWRIVDKRAVVWTEHGAPSWLEDYANG